MLYLDTGGDKNNTIFNATHFSQLPGYSKYRCRPLGSSKFWHSSIRKKLDMRYFKSKKLLENSIVVKKLVEETENTEYIPISLTYVEEQKLSKKTSTNSSGDSLGIMDDATLAYTCGKSKAVSDSELTISEINPERHYWQERVRSFNERLAKEPNNVELWCEFIDIQDKAIVHIFDWKKDKNVSRGKNLKLLNERKISLLDSAIQKNFKSLKLHLKRLDCGQAIWDNQKIVNEWDKLVNLFPNDISTWTEYLIFHQTYFPIFNLNKIVKAYHKCTERLIQMQRGTFLSHLPPENVGFILIDLAVQLSYIWYQGGFMERSVALFQALLEMNFFCPAQLRQADIDDNLRIEVFEAFWDSKAPRFGEEKSIGWAKFMEKREPVEFEEEILEGQRDEEDEILSESRDKHKLWIALESSRESNHWLPWQKDPENCEDLERMVSFSVIKKHLFFVNSDSESVYLSLKYLEFLGVSIPSFILETFPESSSSFYPLKLESVQCFKSSKDFLCKSFFDFPVIGPSLRNEKSKTYLEFVIGNIERFIDIVPSEFKRFFVIILIRLFKDHLKIFGRRSDDHSLNFKTFKNKIKGILSLPEYANDLDLYFEYAQFESEVGRNKDAVKTHSLAIQMALQLSNVQQESLLKHLIALVKLFTSDREFGQDPINRIINIINSVILTKNLESSADTPNGGQLLRTKSKLHQLIASGIEKIRSLCFVDLTNTCSYLFLLSLIQLFTAGLKPSCALFEEILCKISDPNLENNDLYAKNVSKFKEVLYEYYLWIIDFAPVIKTRVSCNIPPSSVRDVVGAAVSVSKSNAFFLEKLVKHQGWRDIISTFHFENCVGEGILLGIFKLLPQVKKVVNMLNSTENGVIGAGYQLENALESFVSSSGRNCPLLWRLYIRLILSIKPGRTKDICVRAINCCPNAKCLYMDYITFVPDSIRDVLRLMEEKGIRVRLPLEELDLLMDVESELAEEDSAEPEQTDANDAPMVTDSD